MLRSSAIVIAVLTLGACTPVQVQLTSGESYVARYEADVAASPSARAKQSRKHPSASPLEQKIRKAASIEPILRFPARIGLARLENGRMTDVPAAELKQWKALSADHRQVGQFVTVNVLGTNGPTRSLSHFTGTRYSLEGIRLAAAHQHLDAVLVYEMNGLSKKYETPLAFTDLTIIGGAVLPTRSIKAEANARALLVDVRNGYPYGSVSTEAKLDRFSTTWGADAVREELRRDVMTEAYVKLTPKVKKMFQMLLRSRQAKLLKRRKAG